MAPPIRTVLDRIVFKNEGIAAFWRDVLGWAPLEAAELLSKSRLDWQVALSHTLALWFPRTGADASDAAAPGRLILAWVNLGALIEGSLKWFLSVYYDNYRKDIAALRDKAGALKDPDGLTLEALRVFFMKSVWVEGDDHDTWIAHVQQRRNAVHAFKHRDIGTIAEFEAAVRKYESFIEDLDERVPYPDEAYRP